MHRSFINKTYRTTQNLPNNTPNASHLALVGWHSLDYRIAILKLCFLWRVLCLPIQNIYRRIITFFLQLCLNDNYVNLKSPTYSMYTYVKRFHLTDVLLDSLNSDNQGKVSSYKKIVKSAVYEYEAKCWKATMSLLYNPPFYDYCVLNIQMHPWWLFVKASPKYYRQASSVLALICNVQPKFFQCNFDSRLCKICCDRSFDNPVHVLFECSTLETDRNLLISKLRFCMPLAMKNEFNEMTHVNKCKFILSAMNSRYNEDWMLIYQSMSTFVYEMYKERKKLYLNLNWIYIAYDQM